MIYDTHIKLHIKILDMYKFNVERFNSSQIFVQSLESSKCQVVW